MAATGGDGKYKSGQLQYNPYTREDTTFDFVPGTTGWYPSGWAWSSGMSKFVLSNGGQYKNTVLDKLIEKINNHSVGLGNDVGTGKQTIDMVTDTCKRFTSAIKLLRRGKIPAAVRALGASPRGKHRHDVNVKQVSLDISSMWLELQYGWKPLLSDVYDVYKAFYLDTYRPQVQICRASAGESYIDFDEHTSHEWPYQGFSFVAGNSSRAKRTIIAHNVEILSLSRTLGLDDPLSLAWEVLPWSFVVDWFIPIGNYINELHQIPNWVGTYEIIDVDTRYWAGGSVGDYPTYQDGAVIFHHHTYNRSITTSLDVPMPHVKSIRKVFSAAHMENALALLRQQFAG
jgi:hypothetical protein